MTSFLAKFRLINFGFRVALWLNPRRIVLFSKVRMWKWRWCFWGGPPEFHAFCARNKALAQFYRSPKKAKVVAFCDFCYAPKIKFPTGPSCVGIDFPFADSIYEWVIGGPETSIQSFIEGITDVAPLNPNPIFRKIATTGGTSSAFYSQISSGASCAIRIRCFLRSATWRLGFCLLMSNFPGPIFHQNPFKSGEA